MAEVLAIQAKACISAGIEPPLGTVGSVGSLLHVTSLFEQRMHSIQSRIDGLKGYHYDVRLSSRPPVGLHLNSFEPPTFFHVTNHGKLVKEMYSKIDHEGTTRGNSRGAAKKTKRFVCRTLKIGRAHV